MSVFEVIDLLDELDYIFDLYGFDVRILGIYVVNCLLVRCLVERDVCFI